MPKMTLQEQCEGPVMPVLDLDTGDASGAHRPFNQWLEFPISLISFALASVEMQALHDATRRLKHAVPVPKLVLPPAHHP